VEYTSLTQKFPLLSSSIKNFLYKLINFQLCERTLKGSEINKHLFLFLKEIKGEVPEYTLYARLSGVVILTKDTKDIKFNIGNTNICLRKITKEDLKEQIHIWSFDVPRSINDGASAILELKLKASSANEAADRMEQTLSILRLFYVASVYSRKCSIFFFLAKKRRKVFLSY
jgi:hypothetical protein